MKKRSTLKKNMILSLILLFLFVHFATSAKANASPRSFPLELDLFQHDDHLLEIAHNWSNKGVFNCIWQKSNIQFSSDGIMSLSINPYTGSQNYQWSAAEYRSRNFYGYGKYEVCMKPIKNPGVVSSFFTYTGASDNNPWDEIDIEFLGKNTEVVQFNYFVNNVGHHEYIHHLGFDASEDFHTYAFEWKPDSITWYVDGQEVYATENGATIPSNPGKIMMNVWPGKNVDNWLGKFDGTAPLSAEYDWVRFTPLEEQSEIHYETGWYEPWNPHFVLSEQNGVTKVTYKKYSGKEWAPIYLDISENPNDYNYFVIVAQGIAKDNLLVDVGNGYRKTFTLTGNTDYLIVDLSNYPKHLTTNQLKLVPSAGVLKEGWLIIRDCYFAQSLPQLLS